MLTAPEGVGAGSQQALPQVAASKDLALTQRHVSEVMAGRTALVTFERLQLSVIDKAPLLHPISASTHVLIKSGLFLQHPWQTRVIEKSHDHLWPTMFVRQL